MSYQISNDEEKDTQANNDKIGNTNIKIRNFKKFRVKSIVKDFAIIILATVSGGFAGAYIANLKNNVQKSPKALSPIVNKLNNENKDESVNAVSNVVKIVSPSIVGISNKSESEFSSSSDANISGIIYDSQGYIVTDYAGIKGSSQISVKLSGSKLFSAKIIGNDAKTGIAVLKINVNNLPAVKLGDSSGVDLGEQIIGVCNPGGEESAQTVTAGIISGLNHKIVIKNPETGFNTECTVIQTDAQINSLFRGAPLCNSSGEVIGLACSSLQKYNYILPINDAVKIIDGIIKQSNALKASMGIIGITASSAQRKALGFYILYVEENSGAYNADIRPTDILIEIDKLPVNKIEDINNILSKHQIGDTITCKISRKNTIIEKSIVLSEAK